MKLLVSIIVPIYNVQDQLESMLESVRQQRFKDFEVLMIDDGSEDSSLIIAKEFAKKDSRFKLLTQKNVGVSATRNRGIEEARGKYVLFYDADDYIPKNAVGDMVAAAQKVDADITIGILQVDNDGSRTIATAKKLVRQRNIDPKDVSFIHTWSVCNKMFKLSFLITNNLRFEQMKHSEDAVFTYATLAKANSVTGCNSIVYRYIKRSFWSGSSATQLVTMDMLHDLLTSHGRIIEECENIFESSTDNNERESYLSKLYARFISNEVMEGFYRRIWVAEPGVSDLVVKQIKEYRRNINDDDWKRIAKKHDDFFEEDRLLTPDEIKSRISITVLMEEKRLKGSANLFLKSLYAQQFAGFHVLIEQGLLEEIDDKLRQTDNIEVCQEEIADNIMEHNVITKLNTPYVMIGEAHIYPTKDTLYILKRKLDGKESLAMSSALVKYYDGEGFCFTKEMKSAFGYKSKPKHMKDVDSAIGNKLIRQKCFPISNESLCGVVRSGAMVSDLNEKEFKSIVKQKFRAGQYIVNSGIGYGLSLAKTKFAREDVDLILKKFKRDSSGLR